MKETRSIFLSNNNPGAANKGKTYEEIYGKEKAAELKKTRSLVGKQNRKIYVVIAPDGTEHEMNREDIALFCKQHDIKPSPLYAHKEYNGWTLTAYKPSVLR